MPEHHSLWKRIANLTKFFASLGILHILYNQERGAEVNESANSVLVREELVQHFDEFLLAIIHVNQILVLLDQLEALVELRATILLRHVSAELLQVT